MANFEQILSRTCYKVIVILSHVCCLVQTGKCRKSFHNYRKLLSTGVKVQNVSFGECLSDWFS